MASTSEVQLLLDACEECVRRGSNEAQRWIDSWLAQHEAHVWPVLMTAIANMQIEYEIKYFLFVCLCRRLRLFGVPTQGATIRDIVQLVDEQVREYCNAAQSQSPVVKEAILALALATVKSASTDTNECIDYIAKTLELSQLLEYLHGIAEHVVLASTETKAFIKGTLLTYINPHLRDTHLRVLLSAAYGASAAEACSMALMQPGLDTQVIHCMCAWVTSSLIEISDLSTSELWARLCGMLGPLRPAETDCFADLVEWLVEHYRSLAPFEETHVLENPMFLGPLAGSLHANKMEFLQLCADPDADG